MPPKKKAKTEEPIDDEKKATESPEHTEDRTDKAIEGEIDIDTVVESESPVNAKETASNGEDDDPVDWPPKTKPSLKEIDLKDEWKEKLIDAEISKLAELPEGKPKEAVLIQYRPKEGDPLYSSLIMHNRKAFEDAWDFYRENKPNARPDEFISMFITKAGIDRTSYRKVNVVRIDG